MDRLPAGLIHLIRPVRLRVIWRSPDVRHTRDANELLEVHRKTDSQIYLCKIQTARLPVNWADSFVAEGDEGIDAHGAARGDVAGEERHDAEQQSRAYKHDGIGGFDAVVPPCPSVSTSG